MNRSWLQTGRRRLREAALDAQQQRPPQYLEGLVDGMNAPVPLNGYITCRSPLSIKQRDELLLPRGKRFKTGYERLPPVVGFFRDLDRDVGKTGKYFVDKDVSVAAIGSPMVEHFVAGDPQSPPREITILLK